MTETVLNPAYWKTQHVRDMLRSLNKENTLDMEGLYCRTPLGFPRLHDPWRTCAETVTVFGLSQNANLCYYLQLCARIQLKQIKLPLAVKKSCLLRKQNMNTSHFMCCHRFLKVLREQHPVYSPCPLRRLS